ncbi:hypothetical protein CIB48_g12154 [Xylaria polymorpha]|nr:hypothetical protein CIB48_g12154 [Xylaria polymorpha]
MIARWVMGTAVSQGGQYTALAASMVGAAPTIEKTPLAASVSGAQAVDMLDVAVMVVTTKTRVEQAAPELLRNDDSPCAAPRRD